jgi:hypothetical protein
MREVTKRTAPDLSLRSPVLRDVRFGSRRFTQARQWHDAKLHGRLAGPNSRGGPQPARGANKVEPQAHETSPAVATRPAAKPTPKWQKWMTIVAGVLLAGSGVLKVGAHFYEAHTLPSCDSRRARDTLSDAFKEKQFSPTSYREVKTLSKTSDLVDCEATLPSPQGTLDVKYQFIWNGSDPQMKYTIEVAAP